MIASSRVAARVLAALVDGPVDDAALSAKVDARWRFNPTVRRLQFDGAITVHQVGAHRTYALAEPSARTQPAARYRAKERSA